MNLKIFSFLVLFLTPLAANAEVGKDVAPLPCGIYDQAARPFIKKDLNTQKRSDRPSYTMAIGTKNNRRISVTVQNVSIQLPGERYSVTVFVDGKPYAKASHEDLPIYLEVHVDDIKYRVICVRTDTTAVQGSSPGGEDAALRENINSWGK